MNRIAKLACVVILVGCTGNDAREDLDVENQHNDNSDAIIGVSPDGFPNVAHKCLELGPVVVGYWTTTDRSVLLIYNDHACERANPEQPQEVISMIPRSMVTAG